MRRFDRKTCLHCCRFEGELDDYSIIMVKALSDRLAEVGDLICVMLSQFLLGYHSSVLSNICLVLSFLLFFYILY